MIKPVAASSGESLLTDKKPEQATRDAIQTARAAQAKSLTFPEEVERAFHMIRNGISKASIARQLETSTRSIGRWIEKYGDPFSLVSPSKEEPKPEPVKEESPVSDEDFAKLVQSSEVPKTTKAEQMRKLYNNWILGGKKPTDLLAVRLFKANSKKSYSALGLTETEQQKIAEAE